jgi:hypothetical protein
MPAAKANTGAVTVEIIIAQKKVSWNVKGSSLLCRFFIIEVYVFLEIFIWNDRGGETGV